MMFFFCRFIFGRIRRIGHVWRFANGWWSSPGKLTAGTPKSWRIGVDDFPFQKGVIFLGEPAVNCQGCRLNYQQPRWITNIKPKIEKWKISCCVIIPFWKWNFEMATHLSYTEMQHILTLCPEDKWHLWGFTFLLVWEVRNCYMDWILTRISMLHQRFHVQVGMLI